MDVVDTFMTAQCYSCLSFRCVCCLRIVVPNIYFVVSLFCLSLSCVPYVASFSGLFIWYSLMFILDLFWLLKICLPQCPQIKLMNVNGT
jgi:hypothetical protein